MTIEVMRFDTYGNVLCRQEIPDDIVEAANKIERWMGEHNHKKWELMGLCSRNHAECLRSIQEVMQHQCF